MSLIKDKIEDFLEKHFDITFDNEHSMLSIAYIFFYIFQFSLYMVDAYFEVSGIKKAQKYDNVWFLMSFFLISAVYVALFVSVEPENRRVLGACGILASVHLLLSTAYCFYIFLNTDVVDERQMLYYTIRFTPISMVFLTILVCISVVVLCKMSFFRSYTKVITDLYDIEEKNGKKGV